MPSKVTLYWPSTKPRKVDFVSPRPGPLDAGWVAILGAMVTIVLKFPVGATDSSMKAREMIDCGCVVCRLACVGATEAAVPLSAVIEVVAAAPFPVLPPTVPRSTVSARTRRGTANDRAAIAINVTSFFGGSGQMCFIFVFLGRNLLDF